MLIPRVDRGHRQPEAGAEDDDGDERHRGREPRGKQFQPVPDKPTAMSPPFETWRAKRPFAVDTSADATAETVSGGPIDTSALPPTASRHGSAVKIALNVRNSARNAVP